jgi:hypothetical protein
VPVPQLMELILKNEEKQRILMINKTLIFGGIIPLV